MMSVGNKDILDKIYKLLSLYREGGLGGEIMPEDANPGLNENSLENYLYFTLPMALNYQRNSYGLWQAALKTYHDDETKLVFIPQISTGMSDNDLREKLLKYKVALQPNQHIKIWKTISNTLAGDFAGDVRNLLAKNAYDITRIKDYVVSNKKGFPYLAGTKILNYWLYVIEQYTDAKFTGREHISVAPDTHVIQASVKLGLIDEKEAAKPDIREYLSILWHNLLKDETISPIDVHTPMWLWSRNGFKVEL